MNTTVEAVSTGKVLTVVGAPALSPDQKRAQDFLIDWMASDIKVATLEGYAGTGKTYLVGKLLQEWSQEMSVAVCAPTHKAVAVLQSKCGDVDAAFLTVHKLLELKVQELDDGTTMVTGSGSADALNAVALVVVDEASMVGEDLFCYLTTPEANCKVLFVGDPAQLAPVVPGARLAMSPAFTAVPHRIKMTGIVRQAEGNPIIALSLMLREAIVDQRLIGYDALIAGLPAGYQSAVMLANSARMAAKSAIGAGFDTRILSFDNRAVLRHNAEMRQMLGIRSAYPFAPGERVVFNSEFKRAGIVNNTEMTVVSVQPVPGGTHGMIDVELRDDDERMVTVPFAMNRDEVEQSVRACFERSRDARAKGDYETAKKHSRAGWSIRNSYADLRHTYASTVHKSQGSTFEIAVLDWGSFEKSNDAEMRNRLAYVAVTRPSKFLAIARYE